MKYGMKIYAGKNESDFPKLVKEIPFDFVEAMIEPSANFSYLKKYDIDYVIHAAHSGFGINVANPRKKQKNISAIKHAINASNDLKADVIIVHPGYIENKDCTLENAINFVKKLDCDKIIFENLYPHPAYKKGHLGYSLEDIKKIREEGIGFCLDIGHASLNAYNTHKNYINFIEQLIELRPKHYHFTDCIIKRHKDHQHFGDGNLDLGKIKRMVPKNARISIETGQDERLKEDFEYLRSI